MGHPSSSAPLASLLQNSPPNFKMQGNTSPIYLGGNWEMRKRTNYINAYFRLTTLNMNGLKN